MARWFSYAKLPAYSSSRNRLEHCSPRKAVGRSREEDHSQSPSESDALTGQVEDHSQAFGQLKSAGLEAHRNDALS
jgi:hypothetical protein